MKSLLPLVLLLSAAGLIPSFAAAGLETAVRSEPSPYPRDPKSSIERLDTALDALLDPQAPVERLATGFDWSEGPVWLADRGEVVFSDVPRNRAYRWSERAGLSVFLEPSGYTGSVADSAQQGSNGLTTDAQGRLVLCQHGDRRVARLAEDGRSFVTLVDRFGGKRFSSPNDLCFDRAGNLYFTDPPYGLPTGVAPEQPVHGVYRLATDGRVTLLHGGLERPNGIALSPDGGTLYVANSHEPRPVILALPLAADGTVGPARVLWDSTELTKRTGRRGAMDGLKVDVHGNLWATGPGGVLVLSPAGRHLGSILTGRATANCAFGDADRGTLYLTADEALLRVRTRAQGARP